MFSLNNAGLPILEITPLELKNYYWKVNSLLMYHISAVTQKNKASTQNKTRRLEEHNRDVLFPIYNVCLCLYVCDILITKICSITLVIGERLSVGLFVYHCSISLFQQIGKVN